jgi:uncharacterized membrane protein
MNEHPLIEQYLNTLDAALARFDVPERKEVIVEIRSHIAEALAEGKPLATVLAALGSAEDLARGYAVELTLNPRSDHKPSFVLRTLRIMSILVVGSILTMLVVGTLGSIGVGFTLSGVAVVVIAAIEAAGIHLPNVQMAGLPPGVVILIGIAIFLIGVGALYALRNYMRVLIRASRSLLPGGQSRTAGP